MILSFDELRNGILALISLPALLGISGIYILVVHALAYAFSSLPCILKACHITHIESLDSKSKKIEEISIVIIFGGFLLIVYPVP